MNRTISRSHYREHRVTQYRQNDDANMGISSFFFVKKNKKETKKLYSHYESCEIDAISDIYIYIYIRQSNGS